MSQPAALPDAWVGEIFRRLVVTYGRSFLGRWEGVDLADVRADWARQLAGLSGPAVAHALDTLPSDQPPTALQFRDAARRCPEPARLALAAPQAGAIPPAVAEELRRMRDLRRESDALQWARDLRDREERQTAETPDSVRMTPFQRAAWREALA